MRKLYLLALLSAICSICIFVSSPALATDNYQPNDVVISQIYVGATGDATQEFISIYNNSDHDVDISNWCVSSKNIAKLACFKPLEPVIAFNLPSHTYATISSDNFSTQNIFHPDVKYQTTNNLSGSIVASADNITLTSAEDQIINSICWSSDKTCGFGSMTSGYVFQRQPNETQPNQLLDTGAETDFKKINTLIILPSGLEERVAVDVCLNLDGVQESAPDGYLIDEQGNCNQPPIDICKNIDGFQSVIPFGYEFDDNGDCQPDVCLNINGLQLILPVDYKKLINGDCVIDLLPLEITELLPNAVGSDEGNEFIEIHNSNNVDVNLSNYILDVGLNYEHSYNFPSGSQINAGQYLKFSNDEIKFTLLNTSSRVRIRATDNSFIYEVPIYIDPDSGVSWALINDVWQYTNQPTPDNINLPSIIESSSVVIVKENLKPCKEGQYRNEETGRCRNIVSDVVKLIPCAEGQERNPDTNRCRSVAILAASHLKPCDDGQERNPDTNRCRNIAKMPEASYKPVQIDENSNNDVLYLSLAGVGAAAIGYGIWEWRVELKRFAQKLMKRHK